MTTSFTPLPQSERIEVLDIIRGFAIFGIFTVNTQAYFSPWLYIDLKDWWNTPLDIAVVTFIDIFFQASFYPLFSILFGFGTVLFKKRCEQKDHSFLLLYIRRLIILLVIGSIHAFLIWHGDILISYALIGLLLLIFFKKKAVTWITWSFSLLLIPALLFGILLMSQYPIDAKEQFYSQSKEILAQQSLEAYRYGSFIEITGQRIHDWYYVNNLGGWIFLILSILPMFLLGAFIAEKKWFHHPDLHQKALKWLWFISLCIGVAFKLAPYIYGEHPAFAYWQDNLGGPAISLFYATTILWLSRKQLWRKLLTPLEKVGRLSLSHYLFQSILSTFLSYSYGFGLYGSVTPSQGLFLTILIFLAQMAISHQWLKYFAFGPAEWLWRSLTYGRIQPILKKRY